jgi:FkbM family methyltransferase
MPNQRVLKLGRRILSPVLGRPTLQPFFHLLRGVAIAGMGYGEGDSPATSGEDGVLMYIRSCLQVGGPVTVFDVGANVGLYTDQVLRRWGDQTHVWCFEPSPATFAALYKRLGEHPNVTLENLGLSDTGGSATLYTRGEGSKIASLYKRNNGPWRLTGSEQVRVETLDSYCDQHGIDAIDLLKLDVEGHELSVLQGAARMLEGGAVRFVQFEFSAASIDSRVYFRDYWELLSRSHNLYRVLAHGLTPIMDYDYTQEVFDHATNYLAEKRQG